jgi:hypothetical protein
VPVCQVRFSHDMVRSEQKTCGSPRCRHCVVEEGRGWGEFFFVVFVNVAC